MELAKASSGAGCLTGVSGVLRPNPKRVVPLAFLLVRVVKQKSCCGSILEALTGALGVCLTDASEDAQPFAGCVL